MAFDKVGIGEFILHILKEAYPSGDTIEELHERMVDRFPSREASPMLTTLKDQIYRQLGEKGYTVLKRGISPKRFCIDPDEVPEENAPRRQVKIKYVNEEDNVVAIQPVRTGITEEAVSAITRVKNDLNAAEGRILTLETRTSEQDEEIALLKLEVEEAKVIAASSTKTIRIKVHDRPVVELNGKKHAMLDYVLKLVNTRPDPSHPKKRMNVLLVGPTGSGKTYLAEQVAEVLELPFSFNTFTAGMSEGQLLGRTFPIELTTKQIARRIKKLKEAGLTSQEAAAVACQAGAFRYIRSEFVKCFEEGGVYLADEIDAGDSNTSMILNTALDGDKLAVPNRPEKPYAFRHDDFVFIGAANTFGHGADRLFVGRNQLDAALLNRLVMGQVEIEYDPSLEIFLCPDTNLRKRFQMYRKNCTEKMVRKAISSRALRDAYAMKLNGISDEQLDKALFGGWSKDEIIKAKEGVVVEGNEDEPAIINEPGDNPPNVPIPTCPVHQIPMVRMGTNKGWRCNVSGNMYMGDHKWSLCSHVIWDRPRRR